MSNKTLAISNKLRKLYVPLVLLIESILVIFYVFFEEVIWERLAKPMATLLTKILKERAMLLVQKTNKYAILFIFLVILIFAEAFGIGAGALFLYGHILTGMLFYIVKIFLAGASFWFLNVAKEKLFSIYLFKKGYDFVITVKNRIEKSDLYTRITTKVRLLKKKIKDRASFLTKKGKMSRIYKKMKEIFSESGES